MDKIIALIPAYNEQSAIQEVLMRMQMYVHKILVIDDCSTDNTIKIAKNAGAEVLQKNRNLGKGDSLRRGFDYAFKNKYDYVLLLDADGEHNPDEIPLFLKNKKAYDIVVGQRRQYRSFVRRVVNYFSNFWFTLLIPGIRDTACGFRLISIDLLHKMNIKSNGFEVEVEMLLEAKKHNARIGLVDIKTKPMKKSHVKISDYVKINNLYDRWIMNNIFSLKINALKKIVLFLFASMGLLIFRWFE